MIFNVSIRLWGGKTSSREDKNVKNNLVKFADYKLLNYFIARFFLSYLHWIENKRQAVKWIKLCENVLHDCYVQPKTSAAIS